MRPLVSIIMPTYNCGPYISAAIDSVLAQEYQNYELIIIDDGSTDDTEKVLKQYKGNFNYIKQNNAGPSAARNRGIKESRGEILAFLDSDDIWYPDRLEKSVGFLLEHPDVKMVSSDVDFFDETGIVINGQISLEKTVHEGSIYDKLFLQNFISTITVTFWKECLDKAGIFDLRFRHGEEYDLWLRISHFYKYGFIRKSLSGYRLRAGSLVSEYESFLRTRLKIIAKHEELFPDYFKDHPHLIKMAETDLYFRYGYNFFHAGKSRQSRQCFLNVIKRNPINLKSYLYLITGLLPTRIFKAARSIARKE
jgi:glycosyltransferase involved in cell wall biosynthesis